VITIISGSIRAENNAQKSAAKFEDSLCRTGTSVERTWFRGEMEASMNNELVRGTFAVTFFLAALEILEMEGVRLEDL
jgi:hypothetical protein